jgi:hypothetical protein
MCFARSRAARVIHTAALPSPGVHCEQPPLCDTCVARVVGYSTGVAAARGVTWGRRIRARHRPADPPVNFTTPRALAIARRYLADVTRDERVRDQLVPWVVAAAEAEWRTPTCGPRELATYR